ncbi:DUF58 domain-containing protein [Bacillus sp. HMF5848]|uniref:DUF58 domain-containing protein n=1 Tax=Bacillus sp. HMF5848 TaxID=2495421 RepID=UPI000F7B8D83|nr:DUF58 domain-containing protein [Bacillus sp. HMF5848]RSK25740.1 DUF58 domain-containing protein [Bacillus sp. HMF5848]
MNEALRTWRYFGKAMIVFLLLALAFVYAMFEGGFVSWFLFYSFLPLAVYSVCIAIYPIKTWRVERTFKKGHYLSGDTLNVIVTIKRRVPFPLLYLVIEDHVSNSLLKHNKKETIKTVLFPWFRRHITYEYHMGKLLRGEHVFSAVRIKTGDVFGFIEKERICPIEQSVIVYPSYEKMAYVRLENRFEQGGASSRTKIERDTTMAVGVRDYQAGDRFSWIDWKATARKNAIMTKEFELQQSYDVVMFLDRTPSHQFESSVKFATSIAKAVLKTGARLGYVSSGEERFYLPLRGGQEQDQRLYYHFAKVQDNAEKDFATLLEAEVGKWPITTMFIIILSSLDYSYLKITDKLTARYRNIIIFIAKTDRSRVSSHEQEVADAFNKKGIYTKFVYENKFYAAFQGGTK